MEPTKTLRGEAKAPPAPNKSAPRPPKNIKAIPSPRKPALLPPVEQLVVEDDLVEEYSVAWESGVNPVDKDIAMKFLKMLATADGTGTVDIQRGAVASTVKVILALLDDTERLAQMMMWHMDVAEEGINVVELLLTNFNAENKGVAKRWYECMRTEGLPPNDLFSPNT